MDSSVWIHLFRSSAQREAVLMDHAIDDAATCGIVIQEVLQGIQPERYVAQIRKSLLRHYYLEAPQAVYLTAAEYARRCRTRGFRLTTIDALIAATAARHRASLWTLDHDFIQVAHLLPIRLYRPS